MKHVILAVILMAPIAANASTGPEIPSVVGQLRCTWLTLQQAARGDFSQWVPPDFVPGRHLRAGEFPDCLPVYDRPRFPTPPAPGVKVHAAPSG
jgi:hypothetical protein